jgi:hypothetical protein
LLQGGLKEEFKKGRGVLGSQGRKPKKLEGANRRFLPKVRLDHFRIYQYILTSYPQTVGKTIRPFPQ